jgi:DNA polymerase/3'-5' exonuclease PolX
MNYTLAKSIADYLLGELREHCLPGYCQVAGGLRREKADVHDIEIICIPAPGAPRPEFGQKRIFTSYLDLALYRLECAGRLGRREKDGPKQKQITINLDAFGIKTSGRFFLDLFIVRPETWGIQYTLRTGPDVFSRKCVTPRRSKGFLPDDCEYIRGETRIERQGEPVPLGSEQDFLNLLGLGWIEPRDRAAYAEA